MSKAKKIVLHFMGEQYPLKRIRATAKKPKKKPRKSKTAKAT